MKTHNVTVKVLLVASTAFAIGCAQSNNNSSSADNSLLTTSGLTATTNPTVNNCLSGVQGSAAPITSYSESALANYAITHPLNSPSQLTLQMDTAETTTGSNQYAGTAYISYVDNNQCYTEGFNAYNTTVPSGTSNGFSGQNFATYNQWSNIGGKSVFHGFYQDQYGAIMVIVDSATGLGDGKQATTVSGQVWFKNNGVTTANSGNIPCWFIQTGPYDCRTLLTSSTTLNPASTVYPTGSLYAGGYYPTYNQNDPARGWVILGKFQSLATAGAFQN